MNMFCKKFHIVTLVNKLDQYQLMRASFIKAGFDENRCRYSVFDNSQKNIYDPYHTFNLIKPQTQEPYIIFCHQDLLMNQGHGFDQLIKVLDDLEKYDPDWAIAGNAGVNDHYQTIAKITDPCATLSATRLPQKVHSLDENFLIIKSAADIESSSEIQGFHFYGTDLCLNAILKAYSCYVIDFHLTHLSAGHLSQSFWDVKKIFQKRWNREFNLCYIKTTMNVLIVLSKYQWIRYFLDSESFQKVFFVFRPKLKKLFNPYNSYCNAHNQFTQR